MVEKLVPNLLLKNQNSAYLWINSLKFYAVCFYCKSKLKAIKFDFTLNKALKKNKTRSGTSLPASSSA